MKHLKNGLKQAGELGVPVAVHAEDHLLLKKATDEFKLNHKDNINAFLKAHDESVELTAVERLLRRSCANRKVACTLLPRLHRKSIRQQ